MIVPWNFPELIPRVENNRNIVVFHSSDLPKGRGWAPIYYSIAEGQTRHHITALLISPRADAGRILGKLSFPIPPSLTAPVLRRWDDESCIQLLAEIAKRYPEGNFEGLEQVEAEATYRARRRPEDNEVSVDSKIVDILPHLRACEEKAPAYFLYDGVKYFVSVKPAEEPAFPSELKLQIF